MKINFTPYLQGVKAFTSIDGVEMWSVGDTKAKALRNLYDEIWENYQAGLLHLNIVDMYKIMNFME